MPKQLICGDSALLSAVTLLKPIPVSYAAPQSPAGQKIKAAGEVETLEICKVLLFVKLLKQPSPQFPTPMPASVALTNH